MTIPQGLLNYGAPADPTDAAAALRFDALNKGLLGLASGLLQAGGPSLQPTSFGKALGIGLGGWQQGREQAAKDAYLQAQTTKSGIESMAQATTLPLLHAKTEAFQQEFPGAFSAPGGAPPLAAGLPAQPPRSIADSTGIPKPAASSVPAPGMYRADSTDIGAGVPGGAPPFNAPGGPGAPPVAMGAGPQTGAASLPQTYLAQARKVLLGVAPEATLSAVAPTDIQKQIAAVTGGYDTPAYNEMMKQYISQATAPKVSSLRPGGGFSVNGGPLQMVPDLKGGYQPIRMQDGSWGVVPVPGAATIAGDMSRATTAGAGTALPEKAYNPTTGRYEFTNRTAAATGGTPLAAGPGGVAGSLGVQPGRFTGYSPPGQTPTLAPQPAPGEATAADKLAGAGADRANTVIAAANDSPVRVNVLDNILSLSKGGVQTGPTAQWKNAALGYLASAPVIGGLFKTTMDDVSKFQEAQKFLYQNALRSWQSAGGTGTDAQMEAFSHANPNDAQFPQALQAMALWGKAGELALQARAKAQADFLQANSAKDLPRFEAQWNQSFDPKIYQMTLMSPAEMQTFAQGLSPHDRQALIAKTQAAKAAGWIQ